MISFEQRWKNHLRLLPIIFALLTAFMPLTVSAQTPTNPSTWRFITHQDRLYIVSGSQEFVTEVDTSQLPSKVYIHPQLDSEGNIYLLSSATSSAPGTALSLYYSRTENGKSRWYELNAKNFGLSPDSGIYDYSVSQLGRLTILGRAGEVVTGQAGVDQSYKLQQSNLPPKVSFTKFVSGVGQIAIPTTQGLVSLIADDGKLNKSSYFQAAIGEHESISALGPALYVYPGPRNPEAEDRNDVTYVHQFAGNSLSKITLDSPVVDMMLVGDYDYHLVLTQQKVWMFSRSTSQAFGQLTDVTAKFGSVPVRAITSYNTGKDKVFFVSAGSNISRYVINSPTDVTSTILKLLAPTYKIASPVSGVGSSGALAPIPQNPNEIVPGQPGQVQGSSQSGTTVQTTVVEQPETVKQSSGWSPVVIISIAAIIVALVLFAILARLILARAKNRFPPAGSAMRPPHGRHLP